MTGRESADFHIVAHQVIRYGKGRDFPFKEFFLVIPAWSPGQDTADIQVFPHNMFHHVDRFDSLRRILVMHAASRVNMMITGEPVSGCGVNPAIQFEVGFKFGNPFRDTENRGLDAVFGTSGIGNGVLLTCRQVDKFPICTIDLVMEEEIGCQPSGGVRVDPFLLVTDFKRSRRRFPVKVCHTQIDFHCREAIEKDGDGIAKTDILCSLADIKGKFGFPFPDIPAVKLDDSVFQFQSGKGGCHRSFVKHFHREKSLADIFRGYFIFRLSRTVTANKERFCIRAFCNQLCGDAGFIVYFHQEGSPTLLHQFFFRLSILHLHATFRTDADSCNAVAVENLLDPDQVLFGFFL